MKNLSMLVVVVALSLQFVSCSKNDEISETQKPVPQKPVIQNPEDVSIKKGTIISDTVFKKTLIGSWFLYYQVSDMGQVNLVGKHIVEFKEDAGFLQNWYDQNGATIQSYKTTYSVGNRDSISGFTVVEFNAVRFRNLIKLSPSLDSMQIFNGVGTEYYIKVTQ